MNLIDHLPRNSFTMAAMAEDPEFSAKMVELEAERDPTARRPPPPLYSWTPEMSVMADMVDAINGVGHRVMLSVGAKGIEAPKSYARPVLTGVEEAKQRQREEIHGKLVSQLLPNRAE